jgi:hypothetical protein
MSWISIVSRNPSGQILLRSSVWETNLKLTTAGIPQPLSFVAVVSGLTSLLIQGSEKGSEESNTNSPEVCHRETSPSGHSAIEGCELEMLLVWTDLHRRVAPKRALRFEYIACFTVAGAPATRPKNPESATRTIIIRLILIVFVATIHRFTPSQQEYGSHPIQNPSLVTRLAVSC